MKIYTKTGDLGETSLFGGKRVKKNNPRVDAYGTVDELNSYIGLIGDFEVNKPYYEFIKEIQDRLFTIGSYLAADPDKPALKKPDLHEEDIILLEKKIDLFNDEVPPLTKFVLPGGHQEVSMTHIARTVCRRAERVIVDLSEEIETDPLIIKYLNRLSDLLFVLSRLSAKNLGAKEVFWNPRTK